MAEMHLEANGFTVDPDPENFGELDEGPDPSDSADLRDRFATDGYVFLRGLLDPDLVLAARLEILTKYAVLGEVDDRYPIEAAIAGDGAGVPHANLRAFSESVRQGHDYTSVVMAPELLSTVSILLDGLAAPFTMRWPRFVRPGEGCGFHCDGPYMNRGTVHQLSTWIPLGTIEPNNGALMLLEGSHRNEELANGYLQMDADRDGLVWLDDDPNLVRERYGKRWLTTTFQPGDVLAFSMNMLHGAFDNRSPENRCRLSSDSRYYRAGETHDPRWTGAAIEGHGPNRVFYPGLGRWHNSDFRDEWKPVDDFGRLVIS